MSTIEVVISILLFLLGFAIVLFLLSPIYAVRSAEAFEERGEEWFIIFKLREANRLNQREKGHRPIDFIGIVPPGRNFLGEMPEGIAQELTKAHPNYWQLQPADPNVRPSTGARTHRYWFIYLWVRYINLFYDVALVGVRRLYRIRLYPIEKTRYKKILRDVGDFGEKETVYEIIPPRPPEDPELSNHVRTAPFDWVVAIVGAETTDRLSWNILMVVNVQTINPWLQLNNHENWSRFLTQAVADATVRGLRKLALEQIVGLATEEAGTGDEARDKIIESVYSIDDRLAGVIGLRLFASAPLETLSYSGAVQILSIEPSFRNAEDRQAFTQVWRSKQEAESEVILGRAEAERESTVVAAVAEAVERHGEAGTLVQRMQALENAARTGKSTIIFDTGGGQSTNNTERLLALLVEDRERERREKGTEE